MSSLAGCQGFDVDILVHWTELGHRRCDRVLQRTTDQHCHRRTNVAMVAYGILAQALKHVVLGMAVTVEPCLHILHHLVLNLRATVMKVWMEARVECQCDES